VKKKNGKNAPEYQTSSMLVLNHQQSSPPPSPPQTKPISILFIGETSSGKSLIRHRLEHYSSSSTVPPPIPQLQPTIGSEFSWVSTDALKKVGLCSDVETKNVRSSSSSLPQISSSTTTRIMLWEIVGGSRFRTLAIGDKTMKTRFDMCVVVCRKIENASHLIREAIETFGDNDDDKPILVVCNHFSSSSSDHDDNYRKQICQSLQELVYVVEQQENTQINNIHLKFVDAKNEESCLELLRDCLLTLDQNLSTEPDFEARRKRKRRPLYQLKGFYPSVADFIAFCRK